MTGIRVEIHEPVNVLSTMLLALRGPPLRATPHPPRAPAALRDAADERAARQDVRLLSRREARDVPPPTQRGIHARGRGREGRTPAPSDRGVPPAGVRGVPVPARPRP